MQKKLFYGFTLFVFLFLLIAWQFAATELAELQSKSNTTIEEPDSQLALVQELYY